MSPLSRVSFVIVCWYRKSHSFINYSKLLCFSSQFSSGYSDTCYPNPELCCLTLQGRDKVAPELGLLGEGGVVGVQVHVHLADSGVARHLGLKKGEPTVSHVA